MNAIPIELCQEDRARIDKVIELLTLSTGQRCQSGADAVQQAFTEQPPVEFTKDTPAEEKPAEPAQEAETKPYYTEAQARATIAELEKAYEVIKEADTAPRVSNADIQQKVIQLSAAGKKAQVREIVTAVATKVSDIPEDKLAEVWAKLNALEG